VKAPIDKKNVFLTKRINFWKYDSNINYKTNRKQLIKVKVKTKF
jgi:hypothetical protein